MTKEQIKILITRYFIDHCRKEIKYGCVEESRKLVDIVSTKTESDYMVLNKFFMSAYDEMIPANEVLTPIKKRLYKQPNLEKLEYMIDAIDFSLNFTNEN